MDKEICFRIDSKNLYIDEYLIELNLPIFFICKDDNNLKYAVMCINTKTLTYVLCRVTIQSILKMLKNNLSLYDFFISSDEKWYLTSGNTIEDDKCEKFQKSPENLLPQKNTFLDLHNHKIQTYIERLQNESTIYEINYGITMIIEPIINTTLEIKTDSLYKNIRNARKKNFNLPISLAGAVFL
nr:hypothetical protein [uncultured Treponema sp.]